jgi:mono/diheme cytochrome c family protein
MNETLFYVFGIVLVVSAVLVSAVGLRFKNFPPSRGALAGTVLYFAVLVGVTAVFAVLNAQDEQEHREAEQAAEEQAAAGGETTTGGPSQATGAPDVSEGKQLFADNGCGSCHTLSAAGSSGTIGPDLDQALQGKPAGFIHQSIVDPNAQVAKGYAANTMPQTFGEQMSPGELDALVAFLMASAGGRQ